MQSLKITEKEKKDPKKHAGATLETFLRQLFSSITDPQAAEWQWVKTWVNTDRLHNPPKRRKKRNKEKSEEEEKEKKKRKKK